MPREVSSSARGWNSDAPVRNPGTMIAARMEGRGVEVKARADGRGGIDAIARKAAIAAKEISRPVILPSRFAVGSEKAKQFLKSSCCSKESLSVRSAYQFKTTRTV